MKVECLAREQNMIITLGIDSGRFGRKSSVLTCMVPDPPPSPEVKQTPGSLDSTKLLSLSDHYQYCSLS